MIRKDIGLNALRDLIARAKGDKKLTALACTAERSVERFIRKHGLPEHGKPHPRSRNQGTNAQDAALWQEHGVRLIKALHGVIRVANRSTTELDAAHEALDAIPISIRLSTIEEVKQ